MNLKTIKLISIYGVLLLLINISFLYVSDKAQDVYYFNAEEAQKKLLNDPCLEFDFSKLEIYLDSIERYNNNKEIDKRYLQSDLIGYYGTLQSFEFDSKDTFEKFDEKYDDYYADFISWAWKMLLLNFIIFVICILYIKRRVFLFFIFGFYLFTYSILLQKFFESYAFIINIELNSKISSVYGEKMDREKNELIELRNKINNNIEGNNILELKKYMEISKDAHEASLKSIEIRKSIFEYYFPLVSPPSFLSLSVFFGLVINFIVTVSFSIAVVFKNTKIT